MENAMSHTLYRQLLAHAGLPIADVQRIQRLHQALVPASNMDCEAI